jgi:hypothetical protein
MFRGSDTNSFRYFLARFKTFTRPQFWLVGLGLVGLVAFAWEFSQHPTWRQALTGKAEDNLTPEEKEGQSIGAEIDSLPLLSADFNPQKNGKSGLATADELAKIKLPPLPDGTKSSSDNSQLVSGQLISGQPSAQLAELDSLTKLFGGSGSNLGNANLGNTNNAASATLTALSRSENNPLLGNRSANSNANRLSTLLSGSSTSGSSNTSATGNVRSSNQLTEALNRYSPATPNPNAPINVQPSEPSPTPTGLPQYTPGLAGNAPVNVPTYNNLPPLAGTSNVSPGGISGSDNRINSYTGLTSGAVPDSLSAGSVGTGVATPIPIGTGGNIPVPIGSTPLPPGTTTIAVPPPATSPAPTSAPFTTPRSIPGRILGGGEINTFSNP